MESKKYTLPAPFAKKWVEALRSGEYEQGAQSLHCQDRYCCLGVACVISGMENVPHQDWIKESMANKFGIPESLVGSAAANELVYQVSNMNDGNETFSEIADWIEANVHFELINSTHSSTQSKIESAYNKQENGKV